MTDQAVIKSREEALDWALALEDDEADDAVYARFLAWLDASQTNACAWAEIERTRAAAIDPERANVAAPELIRISDALPSDPPQSIALPTSQTAPARRFRPWRWGVAVAATIATIAYLDVAAMIAVWTADHATAVGQSRQIILADGSRMQLGAGSAVNVDMTAKERRVELLEGVAFLEVSKEPQRPFVVGKGKIDIRVIGTAFEVRATHQGVAVAVSEGEVSVTGSRQASLTAGERIRVAESAGIKEEVGQVEPANIASWRSDQLTFDNWPSRDVLDALKRHYTGVVLVASWHFPEKRLTGGYDLTKPEASLRLFAATQGWRVRKLAPSLLLLAPV